MFEGNRNDCILLGETLDNMLIPPEKNKPIYAYKGYDSKKCRLDVTQRGFFDRILKRGTSNNKYNSDRCIVERFFGWIKQYRRLILRYDRKINNYLEFCFLAFSTLVFKKTL